jgi:CheY-like chemotaxis protein
VILVVEDNQQLCEALTDFLSVQGHAVKCAANGDEALRLLAAADIRPALILSDVVMPVLDGWGLLTELRKDPQLASVPVVIMSVHRGITERAKESGAAAVVHKLVEPQLLLRTIDHFVNRN